jgi:hypothetical protein
MAVGALIRQQAIAAAAMSTFVTGAVEVFWDALLGVDDVALAQWLSDVVPFVQGAQLQAGAGTVAYLSQVVAEMTGTPPDFRGVPADVLTGPRIRRGVPPSEVYQRPMIAARATLSNGGDFAAAMTAGKVRAVSLATTDVQSSRLYAAQRVLSGDSRVQGFRRSLTGRENCGLCVVASTRRYHKADLMPRHPGCDCVPVPIIGSQDPGEVLNRPLLDSLHQSVVDRFGPDAQNLNADTPAYRELVTVYDHGEYGPTLVRAGDHHLTSAVASARP